MLRAVIGALGALAAIVPDRMLDIFEALAIDQVEESSMRPWIPTGIRGEGIVIAAVSLAGGRAFAWLMNLAGAFGLVLLLRPGAYRRLATKLLYQQPHDVEWDEQFTSRIRLLGVLQILMAVWAGLARRSDD